MVCKEQIWGKKHSLGEIVETRKSLNDLIAVTALFEVNWEREREMLFGSI